MNSAVERKITIVAKERPKKAKLGNSGEGNALFRSVEAEIVHRADFIYYGGLRSHMGLK